MLPKITKNELLHEGKRLAGALAGALIYAAGMNLFAVHSGIYAGGIMGIAQVIRTLLTDYFSLPFENFDISGIIYYIINIPIFIMAITKVGKRFFVRTIICVTAITFFLSTIPITAVMENDILASSILGGIISGVGAGIMLRNGASSGGMDIIGVILVKWKKDFGVGKANLFLNIGLYAVCLFLFDTSIVVYSLIFAAALAMAMDRVHSQNINVEVNIITKKACKEMEEEIFSQLGRGITKWKSMGAYTDKDSEMLYILMSKYEIGQLKMIVKKYDPEAFIVINEGVNVDGHYIKKL